LLLDLSKDGFDARGPDRGPRKRGEWDLRAACGNKRGGWPNEGVQPVIDVEVICSELWRASLPPLLVDEQALWAMLRGEWYPAAAIAHDLNTEKRTIPIDVRVAVVDVPVFSKLNVVEVRDCSSSDFAEGERHGRECDA
jgi:hypothetical protein